MMNKDFMQAFVLSVACLCVLFSVVWFAAMVFNP